MKSKFIIFLLLISIYGLWLEFHFSLMKLSLNLQPPLDFLLSMTVTFLVLIFSKIVLDLLYAFKDIYKRERIVIIFPFIVIRREKINIRFSPYFSFYRKSLLRNHLKYKVIASLLLLIALIVAVIFHQTIILMVFTTVFFWNIADINHLSFDTQEFLFNNYRWEKDEAFESSLYQTLKNRLQTSTLSYSDLMSILLYDATHQCTFLTDNNLFNDILRKIINSHNVLLCTGLVELLMYEISISTHRNWEEKADKIRVQLTTINQLEFFYYTNWLRYNFDLCLIREYDKLRSRKVLISNRRIM